MATQSGITVHQLVVHCIAQQWPPSLCVQIIREYVPDWPSIEAQEPLGLVLQAFGGCSEWQPPHAYSANLLRKLMQECEAGMDDTLADSLAALLPLSGDSPCMRTGVAEAVDRVGIRLFGVLRPPKAISGDPARIPTDDLNEILCSCARVASSHAFSDIGQRCWPATHLLLDLLASPAPAPAQAPATSAMADPVGPSYDLTDLARLLGGKDVLELGSGTGAAAMLLATLPTDRRPRSLVCTELHRVASGVLARNAALNRVRGIEKTGASAGSAETTLKLKLAPACEAVEAVACTSPTEGDNDSCERDRPDTSGSTVASGGSGGDGAAAAGLVDLVPIEECFAADSAPADEIAPSDSLSPTKHSPMRVSVAPLDWADIASGALQRQLRACSAVSGSGAHPLSEEEEASLQCARLLQRAGVVLGADVVYDKDAARMLASVLGFALGGELDEGPLKGENGGDETEQRGMAPMPPTDETEQRGMAPMPPTDETEQRGMAPMPAADEEAGNNEGGAEATASSAAGAISSGRRVGLVVNACRNPSTQEVFLDALLDAGLRFEDASPPDWLGAPLPSWSQRQAGAPVVQFGGPEPPDGPAALDGSQQGLPDRGAVCKSQGTTPTEPVLDQEALAVEFQRDVAQRALELAVPVDPGEWVAPIRALVIWAR